MLSILDSSGHQETFYVGQFKTKASDWLSNHGKPIDIIADGDELDFLRARLSGIPMTMGRVIRWQGAVAQFIADNIADL